MRTDLAHAPMFAPAPARHGFSQAISSARDEGRPSPGTAELVAQIQTLREQGRLALPCVLCLQSDRGEALIFGDLLAPLLSSPACRDFLQARGWIEKTLSHCLEDPEGRELFLPLENQRLRASYAIDAPLERWARQTCSDWTEAHVACSRDIVGDLHQNVVRINLRASDPKLWPGDDPARLGQALDELYAARQTQASCALAQLGPWASAIVLDAEELSINAGAASSQRNAMIDDLRRQFLRQADLARAQAQARDIESALAPGAPSRPKRGP